MLSLRSEVSRPEIFIALRPPGPAPILPHLLSHAAHHCHRRPWFHAPGPPARRTGPDVATALAHHGYIQIDPINVCGRMHDHILRHRVIGYREGGLMRHLHGDQPLLAATGRTAFEHHIPSANILVAFPLEAWPHLQSAMRTRTRRTGTWSGRLSPRQRELVPELLAEITARGPLSSEDFTGTGRSRHVWGAATQAKATLQKLFFHGRLLIARRGEGNRRFYDLPERVLPGVILAQPEPTVRETARWDVLLKLRQRRLVLLKKKELSLVDDLVQAVQVDGCPTLHCLREDLPLFDLSTLNTQLSTAAEPLLLAPLDPLIYDRRVTSALWGYDYTWEAYTPPAKRKRGHYALPVLAGLELVGHVDPKADRARQKLRVVSRRLRRGHKLAPALRALAGFLGLR
jgi:hypothetical protein